MLQEQLDEPYERLIVSGCDRRLLPGPDGLNPYGASVLPRRALALSSCSCSSPSERASGAARETLEKLRSASDPTVEISQITADIREQIRDCLHLAADVEIAMTPSGTDVEILALALAGGNGNREIVNVVIGPGEVGSGTQKAAAGCHYDSRLPRGGEAVIGQRVNEALASRVRIERVDIRDQRGEILSPAEIDAAVTQVVIDAVSRDARVIMHLVAHTKTGIHAPSLGLVERITRNMGQDVAVVVDAAQGRLAPSAYQSALDRGYLVSFTGSKFFGGPPFAGALLVPPQFRPSATGVDRLPPGLENYIGRNDLPESWSVIRDGLDDWCNLGSLLRWSAAVEEMKSYFRIAATTRARIASAFGDSLRFWFHDSPHSKIASSFEAHDADSCLPSIESSATVYSIDVTGADGTPLGIPELKNMHRRLNLSLQTEHTGNQDTALASGASRDTFHLGQPVLIGADRAVLRIALGAPLVIDIASDNSLGSTLSGRIDWLHHQLGRLRERCNEIASLDHRSLSTQ